MLKTLLWLFCVAFPRRLAELLLEPVDVEEDSVQRIAVDTFNFKKYINLLVTDMAAPRSRRVRSGDTSDNISAISRQNSTVSDAYHHRISQRRDTTYHVVSARYHKYHNCSRAPLRCASWASVSVGITEYQRCLQCLKRS